MSSGQVSMLSAGLSAQRHAHVMKLVLARRTVFAPPRSLMSNHLHNEQLRQLATPIDSQRGGEQQANCVMRSILILLCSAIATCRPF